MARPNIEDQGKIRLKNGPQFVHIIGVADARLHDPKRFLAGRRQHGQRQADLVVQVHVRLGGRPAAAQDLREQFLDRGFARRAGEPDHPGLAEALAPAMRQLPKRLDRILNKDERDGRHGIERIPGYQQRGGPGFDGLDRKIVPVERFAGDADEQRAGLYRTAVRAHAFHDAARRGSRHGGTVHGADNLFKTQAHPRISRTVC